MPLSIQAKVLPVLQNQEVQRVGSLTSRKVDVRVMAATNHDLRAFIAEKRLREDLYYRLSMMEIQSPPHAGSAVAAFLAGQCAGTREPDRACGQDDHGMMIDVQDLPGHLCVRSGQGELAPHLARSPDRSAPPDSSKLDEQDRLLLVQALQDASGNFPKAARSLRIGSDALRYKFKQHNLESPASWQSSAAATLIAS